MFNLDISLQLEAKRGAMSTNHPSRRSEAPPSDRREPTGAERGDPAPGNGSGPTPRLPRFSWLYIAFGLLTDPDAMNRWSTARIASASLGEGRHPAGAGARES